MRRGRTAYATTVGTESPVKAAVEAARIRACVTIKQLSEALYLSDRTLTRMLSDPKRMTEFDRETIKKILPMTEEELAVLDAAEIEG